MNTQSNTAQQLSLALPVDLARYWEGLYPMEGRGHHIAKLLHTFAASPLELRRAPPDLDLHVREAIFWESNVCSRVLQKPNDFKIYVELHDALDKTFRPRFQQIMTLAEATVFRNRIWQTLTPNVRRMPHVVHWRNLLSSVMYPCMFIAYGFHDQAEAFLPLLNLWSSGWFPRGTLIDQSMGILALPGPVSL